MQPPFSHREPDLETLLRSPRSPRLRLQGLLYLLKRSEEKQRRMQRQIMKAKRFRERRRNELERKIDRAKKQKRDEMLRERRMIDEEQIRLEELKIAQKEIDKQKYLYFV
jgi:hypothetical protein